MRKWRKVILVIWFECFGSKFLFNTKNCSFFHFHCTRCTYNTPPDSPRCLGPYNDIIQEIDIYALHSIEGKYRVTFHSAFGWLQFKKIELFVFAERREIYFIAIIDVLTQYGVKKQVNLHHQSINMFESKIRDRKK